jgi:adenylate cyclase
MISSYITAYENIKAFELEKKTQKQMQQTEEEQKKSEALILSSLPRSIAERLKTEKKAAFDSVEQGSVCFISIEGFNKQCKTEPKAALHTLNEIFKEFDRLTQKFQCEKIKSFGSTYLAVCGAPVSVSDHYYKIALFALVKFLILMY